MGEGGVKGPETIKEVVEKCNERGPGCFDHRVSDAGVAGGFIRGERGDDRFQEREGERGGRRNG